MLISSLEDAVMTVKGSVDATIANRDGSFEREINMLVVNKITDLIPQRTLQIALDEKFSNLIELADERFNVPDRIDMLLGAEIFYELLRPGQITCPSSKLLLQNTVFGYVVSGCVEQDNEVKTHCGLIREEDLNKTLKKFWEIESVDAELTKSKEQTLCEEHYANTHYRDESGTYVVKMPFKENPSCLGQSRDIALKKLRSLWSRLLKDPNYCELYKSFLKEYEELGHMRLVRESREPDVSYYAPHHGVYRPEKSTTKLRVVFNCTSKTTNGTSLNSIQLNGGVIQKDLFSIMIGFREHAYAFTADVKQMYRMIKINPSQYPLQRIVWSDNFDEEPKTYELLTVTYGTVSAPYLAMRTLLQLSNDEEKKFPKAAPVLREHFYMDDVLTGAPTREKAVELQYQLIAILNEAGMTLHKWVTNFNSPLMNLEAGYIFDKGDIATKTLGVSWNPVEDSFIFRVEVKLSENAAITKRQVLSTIARLYDPIGLLGPVISKAKIFLQRLWLLNLNWDDPLPEKELKEWQQFSSEIHLICNIEIDRCILTVDAVLIEIHGFSDASEVAYGAVLYCKSRSRAGEIKINIVASKSRVSPIKQLSIPRLELSAALLLSKLVKRVLSALQINIANIFLWSDSMIVLSWLRKEPFQLKTFVANRVAAIQELTSVHQWRHVPTRDNPADLISRGVDPGKLLENELWFRGPNFLRNDEYPDRKISDEVIVKDFPQELKTSSDFNCLLNTDFQTFFDNLLKFTNNYDKLVRIFSYVLRFTSLHKGIHFKGPITSDEYKAAEQQLLKLAQRAFFERDKIVSNLKCLNVFRDNEGVLRVGGRLENASLPFEQKHPAVIPKGKFSDIIFHTFHVKHFHVGPQALLNFVRMRFWPLGGRGTARKVVHDCVICFKVNPKLSTQIMSSLPSERVNETFAFNHTGCDLAGPFLVKYKHQRKGTLNKIYICVCICLATRAIHLEILSDLTSEALIATLKRFFARRGKCAKLFSDNAKNFIGANAMLKKWHNLLNFPDGSMSAFLTSEGVDWKYIPPRSPHWGGLWEAGVKSVKFHLKRAVGKLHLTYEEFETVVIQIEGILNSRPLTPLSEDFDIYEALTPAHFLIGRPITALAEPQLLEVHDSRINRWERTAKVVQQVWHKWRNDYLNTLQQRSKWIVEKDNLKIGMLVLIKEDFLPCCTWILGRITEIFAGKDKKVRLVSVKTSNGTFKRPITKIAVLPIEV